jgi:antitoxin StbD
MTALILSRVTASVTDLKRNPMGTVEAGAGGTVAILNRNKAVFYCVPSAEYEAMLDRLDDMDLNSIADARADSPEVAVSLNDL